MGTYKGTGEIRGNHVNVRDGSSMSSNVIDELMDGEPIEIWGPFIICTGHEWAQIRYGPTYNKLGYVATEFIRWNL